MGTSEETNKKMAIQLPTMRITVEMLEKKFEQPELSKRLQELLANEKVKEKEKNIQKGLEIIDRMCQINELDYIKESVIRVNIMANSFSEALVELASEDEWDLKEAMLKHLTIERVEDLLTKLMLQLGYATGKFAILIEHIGQEETSKLIDKYGMLEALNLAEQITDICTGGYSEFGVRHDN